MKRLYILDVSGYLFRAYYALPSMSNAKGRSTHALYGFVRSVLKLIKDFSPEYMLAAFDGPEGKKARVEMYEGYKAGRVSAPEDLPHQFELAAEFCDIFGIPKLVVPGVEADDVMGSVTQFAIQQGFDVFLCTGDKDMCQLVGDHVFVLQTHKENLLVDAKKVEELYGVPPKLIVDYLALIGDSSDNIPGVSGFGPKTAAELLLQFGSLEQLLARVTEVSGKKKQETLMQEREMAMLSQRLALIDCAVPVPQEEAFYRIDAYKEAELACFYEEYNFKALLKELQVMPKAPELVVEGTSICVQTEDDLKKFLDEIKGAKEIVFDVQTTDIDPVRAELVGIAFGIAGHSWYLPVSENSLSLKAFRDLFASESAFYGHNIKYDLQVLLGMGIKPKHISFDTMLASYLISAESRAYSLEHLALQYMNVHKIPFKNFLDGATIHEIPLQKLSDYACREVVLIGQLKAKLETILKERHLVNLLNQMELPLLRVLVEMEREGIFVDEEILKQMSYELSQELQKLMWEIFRLAGEEFNINSPKQLGDIFHQKLHIPLGKKTATGQYSVSAEVLEQLATDYPIAAKLIEYRTLEKLRSTYVDAFPELIHPKTKRIHCTFNQTVAATGRLSCQNPNLQNIPIRTAAGRKVRRAFRPQKEGWSFLAADYSQIELRLLAHLSEDPGLLKAFAEEQDIHAYTASLIFNVPLQEVAKEQRSQAKTVNFGIIYGQQAFGLARELGIPVKAAAAFIEAYFKRYPQVQTYLEGCKKFAREQGKAVTMWGREREIPEMQSKNPTLRALAERLAINTPLQGSAADLIKMAMIHVADRLKKESLLAKMLLQIHDELVFEVPDFELIAVEKLVKEEMQGAARLKIPLRVDIAIGKNWEEC